MVKGGIGGMSFVTDQAGLIFFLPFYLTKRDQITHISSIGAGNTNSCALLKISTEIYTFMLSFDD